MSDNFLSRLKKRVDAAQADDDKPSLFQQQPWKFKVEPDQMNVV